MAEIFRALNIRTRGARQRNRSQKRTKNAQDWPSLPGNSDISSLGSSNFQPSNLSGSISGRRSTIQSISSGHFDTDSCNVSEVGSEKLSLGPISQAEIQRFQADQWNLWVQSPSVNQIFKDSDLKLSNFRKNNNGQKFKTQDHLLKNLGLFSQNDSGNINLGKNQGDSSNNNYSRNFKNGFNSNNSQNDEYDKEFTKNFDPETRATNFWNSKSQILKKNLFETVRFPPYFTKSIKGNHTNSSNLVIFGIRYITIYNLELQKRVNVIKYPQGVCLSEYHWFRLSQNLEYLFGIRKKVEDETESPNGTFVLERIEIDTGEVLEISKIGSYYPSQKTRANDGQNCSDVNKIFNDSNQIYQMKLQSPESGSKFDRIIKVSRTIEGFKKELNCGQDKEAAPKFNTHMFMTFSPKKNCKENIISFFLQNDQILTYENYVDNKDAIAQNQSIHTAVSKYSLRTKKRLITYKTSQQKRENVHEISLFNPGFQVKMGEENTIVSKKGISSTTMVIDWSKRKIRRSGEFLQPGRFSEKSEIFSKFGIELQTDKNKFISKLEEFMCYESKTRHFMFRYNYEKGFIFSKDEAVDVLDYQLVQDKRNCHFQLKNSKSRHQTQTIKQKLHKSEENINTQKSMMGKSGNQIGETITQKNYPEPSSDNLSKNDCMIKELEVRRLNKKLNVYELKENNSLQPSPLNSTKTSSPDLSESNSKDMGNHNISQLSMTSFHEYGNYFNSQAVEQCPPKPKFKIFGLLKAKSFTMLYDFMKHKPILILPQLSQNLQRDPCDFQYVSESKFHRVYISPIIEKVELVNQNQGFFSLNKLKKVFQKDKPHHQQITEKVVKLKFWVKELSMLKKNFDNVEFQVDLSRFDTLQNLIFGPSYLYKNAIFTQLGVYILEVCPSIYLLVDLTTQKNTFFKKTDSKKVKSKIFKVEHSVNQRNNLVIIFTDGTIQIVNLSYQNNENVNLEVEEGQSIKLENSSPEQIRIYQPMNCEALQNLQERNLDIMVSGNNITTIHCLNVAKNKGESLVKDSQLQYLEIEIFRAINRSKPLQSDFRVFSKNLPRVDSSDLQLLNNLKLKINQVQQSVSFIYQSNMYILNKKQIAGSKNKNDSAFFEKFPLPNLNHGAGRYSPKEVRIENSSNSMHVNNCIARENLLYLHEVGNEHTPKTKVYQFFYPEKFALNSHFTYFKKKNSSKLVRMIGHNVVESLLDKKTFTSNSIEKQNFKHIFSEIDTEIGGKEYSLRALKHRISALIQDRTLTGFILAHNVLHLTEILILLGDFNLLRNYILAFSNFLIEENGTKGYKFVQIEALAWKYCQIFLNLKKRIMKENHQDFTTLKSIEEQIYKYSGLADQIKTFNNTTIRFMYPDMDLSTLYPQEKVAQNGGKLIFKNEKEFKIYLRNLKIQKKIKKKFQQDTISEVSGLTEHQSLASFKTTTKGYSTQKGPEVYSKSKKPRQFRRLEGEGDKRVNSRDKQSRRSTYSDYKRKNKGKGLGRSGKYRNSRPYNYSSNYNGNTGYSQYEKY